MIYFLSDDDTDLAPNQYLGSKIWIFERLSQRIANWQVFISYRMMIAQSGILQDQA